MLKLILITSPRQNTMKFSLNFSSLVIEIAPISAEAKSPKEWATCTLNKTANLIGSTFLPEHLVTVVGSGNPKPAHVNQGYWTLNTRGEITSYLSN